MSRGPFDAGAFYESLKTEASSVRDVLYPFECLNSRERFVFMEYHYWKTHMKVVAESLKISLGRAYELLYRAEEKIAESRTGAPEEKKAP